jgi:glutamate-1-semialdehyde aminotransferase|tara:strand:+ start:233 stop:355 length:123 start_codon:yes stop_codon:yes gene_type:complete
MLVVVEVESMVDLDQLAAVLVEPVVEEMGRGLAHRQLLTV